MSYKDKYIKRSQMYGEGIRGKKINNTRRKIESTFKDSEVYYSVKYLPFDGVAGQEVDMDVQIVDKSEVRDEKLITTLDENFTAGGLVDWKNDKWMSILVDEMSDIYVRGGLRRCPTQLKWLDETGKIIEEWISFKMDAPVNFGVEERRTIRLPNERRQIMMRLNDDTRKIQKDQRFIMDGRAWIVMSLDRLSLKNVMYVVFDEDYNILPDDNLELGIANYKSRERKFAVRISNRKSEIKLGTTRKLAAKVYDDGGLVEGAVITYESDAPDIIEIDSNGLMTPRKAGNAKVYARYGDVFASSDMRVLQTMADTYQVIMDSENHMFVRQTKTFNFHFELNGETTPVNATFRVTDANDRPTDLVEVVSTTNNSITIKAGIKLGTIVIHAESAEVSGKFSNVIKSIL